MVRVLEVFSMRSALSLVCFSTPLRDVVTVASRKNLVFFFKYQYTSIFFLSILTDVGTSMKGYGATMFEYYMKKHWDVYSDLHHCHSRYFDLNLMVVKNTVFVRNLYTIIINIRHIRSPFNGNLYEFLFLATCH